MQNILIEDWRYSIHDFSWLSYVRSKIFQSIIDCLFKYWFPKSSEESILISYRLFQLSENWHESWIDKISKLQNFFLKDNSFMQEIPNCEELWYSNKEILETAKEILLLNSFKNDMISPLDFFNLKFDETLFWKNWNVKNFLIRTIWNENVQINWDLTQNWLILIDRIFKESLDFYNRVLYRSIDKSSMNLIKKRVFDWNNEFHFTNVNQIVKFLELTTDKNSNKVLKQICCSLSKIFYSILSWESERNKLLSLENDLKDIVLDIESKLINISTEKELMSRLNIWMETFYIELWKRRFQTKWDTNVKFNLSARPKTWDSIRLKLISDPKYFEIDAIKDFFWLRAQVETIEDVENLLEYILKNFINSLNHWVEIENKWLFTDNQIEQLKLKYNWISVKSKSKKNKVNPKYKDIKIIFPYYVNWKTHKIEFQIVLVNSVNETWLSHHAIYECLKTIETVIRLQWYISQNHIKKIILWFIESYPDLLKLVKKDIIDDKKIFAMNIIFEYILRENKILKIWKVNEKPKEPYYTTKSRRNALKWKWFFPDNYFIFYKWNRTNQRLFDKLEINLNHPWIKDLEKIIIKMILLKKYIDYNILSELIIYTIKIYPELNWLWDNIEDICKSFISNLFVNKKIKPFCKLRDIDFVKDDITKYYFTIDTYVNLIKEIFELKWVWLKFYSLKH